MDERESHLLDSLSPAAKEFVSPTPEALQQRIDGSRAFLDDAKNRRLTAMAYLRRPGRTVSTPTPGGCSMGSLRAADRDGLQQLGFRPIGRYSAKAAGMRISYERWVGPDGAIVVEVADSGKLFFICVTEDNRKLGINRAGAGFRWTQYPHIYLRGTDSAVENYLVLAQRVADYMAERNTRPLYRGTDSELDLLGLEYYETWVKAPISAILPLLLLSMPIAYLALIIWSFVP